MDTILKERRLKIKGGNYFLFEINNEINKICNDKIKILIIKKT